MSALPTAVPMVLADSSAACSPRLGFPPVPAHAMSNHESTQELVLSVSLLAVALAGVPASACAGHEHP